MILIEVIKLKKEENKCYKCSLSSEYQGVKLVLCLLFDDVVCGGNCCPFWRE